MNFVLNSVNTNHHPKITGHYNLILEETEGLRVRDWLAGKSFDEQQKYGIKYMIDNDIDFRWYK